MAFTENLKSKAIELGFDLVGVTSAVPAKDFNRYLEWIRRGFAADMHYMVEQGRREKRGDLAKVLPGVKSVIVGAFSYAPENAPTHTDAKFARYGWGKDYHHVVKEKLDALVAWMKDHAGQPHDCRTYVDTGPILERSLAERSGIGWIGKNTCIINDKIGSYVFLGEILTTLVLSEDASGINRCGTCTRCIDACPTGAIEDAYQLNSAKCISYQTIENRKRPVPESIAKNLQSWIAGCDICQEVCPWNGDIPVLKIKEFKPLPHVSLSLDRIQTMSDAEYTEHFERTSFNRIGLGKMKLTAGQLQGGK